MHTHFLGEHGGLHIRGSECDQKILSKRESTGLVYSPNYPFPYLQKVRKARTLIIRFIIKNYKLYFVYKVDEIANETYIN